MVALELLPRPVAWHEDQRDVAVLRVGPAVFGDLARAAGEDHAVLGERVQVRDSVVMVAATDGRGPGRGRRRERSSNRIRRLRRSRPDGDGANRSRVLRTGGAVPFETLDGTLRIDLPAYLRTSNVDVVKLEF